VIRNVVIHITNEQPLLADLLEMPTSVDVSLVCTNIRMLDGKKPIFVDHSESVFVFPYGTIRFIELMPGSTEALASMPDEGTIGTDDAGADDEPDEDLELDEDFLRRIREA
jgi:hypothetical protein